MIVNVIDTEWDRSRLLEVGITTISLNSMSIIKTYSIPIKPPAISRVVSKEVVELTGWTNKKLAKQGFEYSKALDLLLNKHGWANRLTIMDTNNEFVIDDAIGSLLSPNRINVSLLFMVKTRQRPNLGLDLMLAHYGLTFEGFRHRAADDSFNIAQLFLEVIK